MSADFVVVTERAILLRPKKTVEQATTSCSNALIVRAICLWFVMDLLGIIPNIQKKRMFAIVGAIGYNRSVWCD